MNDEEAKEKLEKAGFQNPEVISVRRYEDGGRKITFWADG